MDLSSKSSGSYFSPEFFKFLRSLARRNNRVWFRKNKQRYERYVLAPSLRFIKDAGAELRAVSPYLVADPWPFGGSLFRIYLDIRFSKDKSPYKTNVAMEFWHRRGGKKSYTGLYLHLAPRQSFAGAGIWHPDPPTLNRVRKAIVSRPEAWGQVKESGLKVEGESLKRPRAGFDANHSFIEDLKLKDITAGSRFSNAHATGPRLVEAFVQAGMQLDQLNRFLAVVLS